MPNAVPFFIGRHILDAEVRAQIHKLCIGKNLFINKGRAEALGCGGKNHIRLLCQFFHIIIQTYGIHYLEHVFIDFIVLLVNIAAGAVPYDFHIRVGRQQSYQLSSRITCRSNNSCFYHFPSIPFP